MRAALVHVQEVLPGRLVSEDNLHLTVFFLGEVDAALLDELHLNLSSLALPGDELTVTGLVTFGGRVPRLIAAEFAKTDALKALHGKVRSSVRAAGLDLPRDRFRPHVTLARFRQRIDPVDRRKLDAALAAHAGMRLPPVSAQVLGLYSSTLTPEGPIYEELARYPLGGTT